MHLPFTVVESDTEYITSILAVILKFGVTITMFVVNLQSMEIYPTCLRQTGLSIGAVIANAFGLSGPYIVRLGSLYDIRIPILVVAILASLGTFSELFLPETLHQKLPETIAEAKVFGKGQPFWIFPKQQISVAEEEKLNQKEFSP